MNAFHPQFLRNPNLGPHRGSQLWLIAFVMLILGLAALSVGRLEAGTTQKGNQNSTTTRTTRSEAAVREGTPVGASASETAGSVQALKRKTGQAATASEASSDSVGGQVRTQWSSGKVTEGLSDTFDNSAAAETRLRMGESSETEDGAGGTAGTQGASGTLQTQNRAGPAPRGPGR